MKGFDLDEALEKAVEEANKMPGSEPPLVLPPREKKADRYAIPEEEFLTAPNKPKFGTYTDPAPFNKDS